MLCAHRPAIQVGGTRRVVERGRGLTYRPRMSSTVWYPYGGLRRFGGSPATLGELVVWAGHGGRVGSPAPPQSEVAENVIYTYSRALGLGYAPRSGTLTPRTECWGA